MPMPVNIDAENNIIGCILKDSKCIDEIIGLLKPNDFYVNSNKFIYTCCLSMYSKGMKIDPITVSQELDISNQLSEVGGLSNILKIEDSVVNSYHIKAYADIVKEKAVKRELASLCQKMLQEACSESGNSKQIMNDIEDYIFNLNSEDSKNLEHISQTMESAICVIERNYRKGGGIIGDSTGFKSLDKVTSGLIKGDFWVIAARPSMGKTAFALNIAQNASKTLNVAFFSLEMSKEQLATRMLSANKLLQLQQVRSGNLNDDEWNKIIQGSADLSNRKMFIDDTAGIAVNEIRAKCRKLKFQHGIDVVVIDYLQLIESDGKAYNREQEVSKTSRALKKLAKELGVTIIALSQLSRAPEQRMDHRPTLSDLRESGSIEQDADIIGFLYRDEYYNKETDDKNITEVITAKNRNGEVKTVKLAWLGQFQRFAELDMSHT